MEDDEKADKGESTLDDDDDDDNNNHDHDNYDEGNDGISTLVISTLLKTHYKLLCMSLFDIAVAMVNRRSILRVVCMYVCVFADFAI